MANVIGQYNVLFDRYLAQFPAVQQPGYQFTDELAQRGLIQTGGYNDLEWRALGDHDACVFPRRIFVPHHNTLPSFTAPSQNLPYVNWNSPTITGSLVAKNQTAYPHQNYEIQLGYQATTQPPVTSASLTTTFQVPTQGFTLQYWQGAEQMGTSSGASMECRWQLGSAATAGQGAFSSQIWYRVVCPIAGQPWIERSPNGGGSWSRLGVLQAGGRKDQVLSPYQVQPPLTLEVLLLGGYLGISLDSSVGMWMYPELTQYPQGTAAATSFPWAIMGAELIFTNIDQARFALHPTKFLQGVPAGTNPQFQSGPQALGFNPIVDPVFQIHFAPQPHFAPIRDSVANTVGFDPAGIADGYAGQKSATALVDHTVSSGTTLVYDLQFSNSASKAYGPGGAGSPVTTYLGQSLADTTACVRAVTPQYPMVWIQDPPSPVPQQPQSIKVAWDFSFDTLAITSSATLLFNNFDGVAASVVDGLGHFAVTIQLGIVGSPLVTAFTGIANTDFQELDGPGGQSLVQVTCTDFWLPMMATKLNLPWFDGWNLNYFASYLYQLGSITTARQSFAAQVPTDPYGATPGGTSYYLPWGPAGTATTRYSGGQRPGDILRKVGYQESYLSFFDNLGNAQWKPFIPPTGAPLRTFTHYADGVNLTDTHHMSYSGTLRNTRNQVSCIGRDPRTGAAILGYAEDPHRWDETQPTFKGFDDQVVWTDAMFGFQSYASSTAQATLNFLKWPERMVLVNGWMPPGYLMAPLDLFSINNPRSGAHGKTFICYHVEYEMATGKPASLSAGGRWYWPGQIAGGTGHPGTL